MLNFFFPLENSLLFSVILLAEKQQKSEDSNKRSVCVCVCARVSSHFSSVNSKLRISAITLSISSFNLCVWTGRSQHLLPDLSFPGPQLWPCLPEYHPEGLSYTSWCSPSPAFHLLWSLRKLQETTSKTCLSVTSLLEDVSSHFPLAFCNHSGERGFPGKGTIQALWFHWHTRDHKPELLECFWEILASVEWHEDVMQTAEHGSITSGSVMVLGLWASSDADLQPRLDSLSRGVKRLSSSRSTEPATAAVTKPVLTNQL